MERYLETRTVEGNQAATNDIINKRPSRVHWITISVKVEGITGVVKIYDGFDDEGTLMFQIEPGYSRHHNFIPSFTCHQGIFVHASNKIACYTIGYCVEPWKASGDNLHHA